MALWIRCPKYLKATPTTKCSCLKSALKAIQFYENISFASYSTKIKNKRRAGKKLKMYWKTNKQRKICEINMVEILPEECQHLFADGSYKSVLHQTDQSYIKLKWSWSVAISEGHFLVIKYFHICWNGTITVFNKCFVDGFSFLDDIIVLTRCLLKIQTLSSRGWPPYWNPCKYIRCHICNLYQEFWHIIYPSK